MAMWMDSVGAWFRMNDVSVTGSYIRFFCRERYFLTTKSHKHPVKTWWSLKLPTKIKRQIYTSNHASQASWVILPSWSCSLPKIPPPRNMICRWFLLPEASHKNTPPPSGSASAWAISWLILLLKLYGSVQVKWQISKKACKHIYIYIKLYIYIPDKSGEKGRFFGSFWNKAIYTVSELWLTCWCLLQKYHSPGSERISSEVLSCQLAPKTNDWREILSTCSWQRVLEQRGQCWENS